MVARPYAFAERLESRRLLSIAGFLTKDINAGGGAGFSGSVDQQVAVDDTLYFAAIDGNASHGIQLWKSDGTAAGTVPVTFIKSLRASGPHNLTAGDGVVFFTGKGANGIEQVWRSDGTSKGTFAVTNFTDANTNLGPYGLTFNPLSKKLFFGENNAAASDADLWVTDASGPNAATRVVQHLDPQNILATGSDYVFFYGTDTTDGQELWFSDGTALHTERLSNIHPGSLNANFTAIAPFFGGALFTTQSNLEGPKFWFAIPPLEGQVAQIQEVDSAPAFSSLTTITNILLGDFDKRLLTFVADDGSGSQVWELSKQTDFLFKPITQLPTTSQGGVIDHLTPVGDDLYFTFSLGGTHLWRIDKKNKVTEVDDDGVGPDGGNNPNGLTNVGGVLYFAAQDNNFTSRLFLTDGKHINLIPNSGTDPNNIIGVGTSAYYQATDDTAGRELHNVGTFNIGSNLTISQGSTVQFHGHFTGVQVKSFKWDLNGDGKYETGGTKPSFTYLTQTATNSSIIARAKLFTIDGRVLTGFTHVTVTAAPPTVTLTIPSHSVPYLPLPYSVKVVNFLNEAAKKVIVRLDFGDGTTAVAKTDSHGVVKGTHEFPSTVAEHAVVTARATDTNGAVGTDDGDVALQGIVSDPAQVAEIDPTFSGVFIGGTDGNDDFIVALNDKKPVGGKFEFLVVFYNTQPTFSYKTAHQPFRIYTGPGNDNVLIADGVTTGGYIDGGLGNDTLTGGAGDDTLVSGGGTDDLDGRGGHNTIIN